MSNTFASDYVDVAERIREFRAAHPGGSLQPADPAQPYKIETLGDHVFVVYVAAAYRTADDPRPGIGSAWEPFPGKSNFTRNSELQNAETSAWGRAIVAALAADTKKIASADEVRNREADRQQPQDRPVADTVGLQRQILAAGERLAMSREQIAHDFAERHAGLDIRSATTDDLKGYLGMLLELANLTGAAS